MARKFVASYNDLHLKLGNQGFGSVSCLVSLFFRIRILYSSKFRSDPVFLDLLKIIAVIITVANPYYLGQIRIRIQAITMQIWICRSSQNDTYGSGSCANNGFGSGKRIFFKFTNKNYHNSIHTLQNI